MRSLFQHEPRPPTADQREKLAYWMTKYLEHFQKSMEQLDKLDAHENASRPWESPADLNQTWDTGTSTQLIDLHAAVECLQNARAAWPGGKEIIDELITATSCSIRILDNAHQLAQLNLKSYSPDAIRAKSRPLIQENRTLGIKGDKLLKEAFEKLFRIVPELG